MIHITASENDITTDKVLEWLWALGSTAKRAQNDAFENIQVSINNREELTTIGNNQVKRLWMRRGSLPLYRELKKKSTKRSTQRALSKDQEVVHEIIESTFPTRIGSFQKEKNNNLLIDLIIAKKAGFKVPATVVTNNRKNAIEFVTKHKCITKHLKYPPQVFLTTTYSTNPGTQKVSRLEIEEMDDQFAPLLLQELIIKKWELRIFVFEKKIYCICGIARAKVPQIDQRYIPIHKIRFVPFELDNKIKNCIHKYMDLSQLHTTSLDVLVSKDDVYYFLESNPMGQFDWVSQQGNYYIEKHIATCLNQPHSFQS